MSVSIVWFRSDLRLSDHPALSAAIERGAPVLCLYIDAPQEAGDWKLGKMSRAWLTHSLRELKGTIEEKGGTFVFRKGSSEKILKELIREVKASAVFWNECYEPAFVKRDEKIRLSLEKEGIEVASFHGNLLYPPDAITDLKGKPYQVFTFFWNASRKLGDPEKPAEAVRKIPGYRGSIKTESLPKLEPIPSVWQVGEKAGWKRAEVFLKRAEDYAENRDYPAIDGTSLLSPYLHFGEVGPKELWHAVGARSEVFLKELMWREFSYNILIHQPGFPDEPLRKQFGYFPWKKDEKKLKAWREGMTGYPMVDAGMRQLKAVNWMHNRVRMVVASFLVKHLLQHWKEGAAWFWDELVDADLANNSMGWQWSAGCGPDAAPFFRIFNPIEQGKKFDPQGNYIRKYLPEIAALPDQYLYAPWEAPEEVLKQARIVLGKTYPKPIVDHKEAREAALSAFHKLKR